MDARVLNLQGLGSRNSDDAGEVGSGRKRSTLATAWSTGFPHSGFGGKQAKSSGRVLEAVLVLLAAAAAAAGVVVVVAVASNSKHTNLVVWGGVACIHTYIHTYI